MSFDKLDIAQLRVFNALYERRCVIKVSRALDLPQPTVSRWFARMRASFGDPMFVRTRDGMEPTSTAVASSDAVKKVLSIHRTRLLHAGRFDPATTNRNFKNCHSACNIGSDSLLMQFEGCLAIAWSGGYSAAKAAFWSATNSMRPELLPQRTHVLALHMGYVDTPMTANISQPKLAADTVVRLALDGLEAGEYEVIGDDITRRIRANLGKPLTELYPELL